MEAGYGRGRASNGSGPACVCHTFSGNHPKAEASDFLFSGPVPDLRRGAEKNPEHRRAHRCAGSHGTDLLSRDQFHREPHGAYALSRLRNRPEDHFLYHAGAVFCDAERVRFCGAEHRGRTKGAGVERISHCHGRWRRCGRSHLWGRLLGRQRVVLCLYQRQGGHRPKRRLPERILRGLHPDPRAVWQHRLRNDPGDFFRLPHPHTGLHLHVPASRCFSDAGGHGDACDHDLRDPLFRGVPREAEKAGRAKYLFPMSLKDFQSGPKGPDSLSKPFFPQTQIHICESVLTQSPWLLKLTHIAVLQSVSTRHSRYLPGTSLLQNP